MNFKDIKKVHFIGIGGASMSALAEYTYSLGVEISGSDRVYSENIERLMGKGIYVYLGENDNIIDDKDLVIYTSAVSSWNAELLRAKSLNKMVMERAEYLGRIEENFKTSVAISGTHGKTTTTALVTDILRNTNLKFTSHIGGFSKGISGNFLSKGQDIFVTEACEYKRHFLSLHPSIAVITNIEHDHPDCYQDIYDVYSAFSGFCNNVKNDGFIIINKKINITLLKIRRDVHIITYGFFNADVVATNIDEHIDKCEYDVLIMGEYFLHISTPLIGRHNIENTLASIAVAYALGIKPESVERALLEFLGVKRRYEKMLSINGADVILDYAHHPSEIASTLALAKSKTRGRVLAYFQPHTFSRTSELFDLFCLSFKNADEVSFIKTYGARESEENGKSAFDLFYYFNENIRECKYFDNFLKASIDIKNTARIGDTVLLLGAGDIDKLVEMLKQ